jgi:tRNA 2-thiouridine synthesizing protein C
MTAHFFLLRDTLTVERLGWIDEILKFYFLKLNPQSFRHTPQEREAAFIFFLTGDALYSLQNPETAGLWESLFSLPSIKIVCDQEELALRGITVERLKMKNPDLVITNNSLALNGRPSFWKDVMKYARQHEQPIPSTIGYLHIVSPYMHQSPGALLRCLGAALESHASWDLYCYLDGIHAGHQGQAPLDAENIGEGLEDLEEKAGKRGLHGQIMASVHCAAARGYCTHEEGREGLVPACTIRPVRIRTVNEITAQFRSNHIILAENCASIAMKKETIRPGLSFDEKWRVPPVNILVTRHPYGSEYTSGALAFAIACAAKEIQTRVIFIEDGVYALSGTHSCNNRPHCINLQEDIDAASGNKDLQFFAYTPSLQARNMSKNPKLTGVIPVGVSDLGNLLFFPPTGIVANHQRVLFF